MKNLCLPFFLLLGLVGFCQDQAAFVDNQIIVKLKPETLSKKGLSLELLPELVSLHQKYDLETSQLIGNKRLNSTFVLSFSRAVDVLETIKSYESAGVFEYVEPNYIGSGGGQKGLVKLDPNDQYFNRQYGLYNDGSFTLSTSTADADVDMELAWDIETGDASIVIAVLDSGFKLNHPELTGRIWQNNEDQNDGQDNDNNGYIDDGLGWDFVNRDNDPSDDHGHGTNVAGIATATGNNSIGYAGIDWNCKLMVCKILDNNNSGLYSWWTDAIYYAVDNGADVINMSVGGAGFSNAMRDAINYAHDNDVTVVACMMNFNNATTYYPAGYANTIAVGSTNPDDTRTSPFFWSATSGSNFGNHIDVVAPGNYIYGLSYQSNTNYNSYWGGTSQATPLVAGISTLLLAQDPFRTPEDIRAILRETAEDQVGTSNEDVAGFDRFYGFGRVNANAALMYSTVNTEDLSQGQAFKVYPNPSSDVLFLESHFRIESVNLINGLGVKVLAHKFDNTGQDKYQIAIPASLRGTYVLQIIGDENELMATEKVYIE